MNVTNRTLDRLMQKYGIKSDYGLAKKIGVTPGSVSNWRKEKTQMADAPAMEVAKLLEIDAGELLAELQAERADSPATRAAWEQIAGRLRQTAATIALGIARFFGFFHAQTARASVDHFATNTYYDKDGCDATGRCRNQSQVTT
ncbi:MAG: DUF3693 domain-containing protein [Steroidobacteraceae bacterium]